MSTRTIVEFNHDYAHAIERNHASFLKALECYLASASEEDAECLKRFGIHRIWTGHHSDDRRIVTPREGETL